MRVIFNEGLKAVADDLDHMARDVRDAIRLAGRPCFIRISMRPKP